MKRKRGGVQKIIDTYICIKNELSPNKVTRLSGPNHFLPVDGDEVADVLVVSVVLPAELYPALGLLVHLGLVHAVRLAQLPGTLGLLGRQDGEPLLLRSLVLLDLVLHLVVKVSTIFCDNFHDIRRRHTYLHSSYTIHIRIYKEKDGR